MPLREVSSRELALACGHMGLPLAASGAAQLASAAAGGAAAGNSVSAAAARKAKLNINALAEAFVAGMETHNPGRAPRAHAACPMVLFLGVQMMMQPSEVHSFLAVSACTL
jgi:hypothetical protein